MRSATHLIETLPVHIRAATLGRVGTILGASTVVETIEEESHLGPCPSCGGAKRTLATCGDYTTQPDEPDEPAEATRLTRIHARYGRGEHLHARCSSCGFVTMLLGGSAHNRYVGEQR